MQRYYLNDLSGDNIAFFFSNRSPEQIIAQSSDYNAPPDDQRNVTIQPSHPLDGEKRAEIANFY